MTRLSINTFGPIGSANIELGNLTILVGAQASGKSLFLEMFKLAVDYDAIVANLKKYNFIIPKQNRKSVRFTPELLDIYLGNGLAGCWSSQTNVDYSPSLQEPVSKEHEQVFYVPAQRILSISDGRPKAFTEFDPTTPYVLRQFSEILRAFLAQGFGQTNQVLFPIRNRLKSSLKKSFESTIFHHGKVVRVNTAGQLKMSLEIDDMQMPFMTWSAGQKEFMPLLLAFYCLSGPPTPVLDRNDYRYVIIEEPEMGLHPQAIKAVLLQIFELMQSGKKVIISTHSPIPLELAWVFNHLKASPRDSEAKEQALLQLFGLDSNTSEQSIVKGIFSKEIKTFFFSRKSDATAVNTENISSLDAWDKNPDISEWGGLSSFSVQASEIVNAFCQDEEP